MRSALDNRALIKYQYQSRILDRRQPMRNHENRLALCELFERELYLMLIFRVCKGGRLIQYDDRRIL